MTTEPSADRDDPVQQQREDHLAVRVARLERFAVGLLCLGSLAMTVTGWVLPWIVDAVSDDPDGDQSVTWRLATAFTQFGDDSTDGADSVFLGVLTGSFMLLDLVTLTTLAMVLLIWTGTWRARRLETVIVVLTGLCVLGAWLTTLLALANDRSEVHPVSVLVWTVGMLLAIVLARAPGLRAWWSGPTPAVPPDLPGPPS